MNDEFNTTEVFKHKGSNDIWEACGISATEKVKLSAFLDDCTKKHNQRSEVVEVLLNSNLPMVQCLCSAVVYGMCQGDMDCRGKMATALTTLFAVITADMPGVPKLPNPPDYGPYDQNHRENP